MDEPHLGVPWAPYVVPVPAPAPVQAGRLMVVRVVAVAWAALAWLVCQRRRASLMRSFCSMVRSSSA
ncbi:hypothetical protein O7632_09020 [Solwaraspora sp. WMMD406]|uniref:hypothetical protein n=1 Tax=Solwaraspora sp. WMMD406 TaxID=3016095 RepID=UPI0024171AE1|nr:hypothetical protein [Solwaraspora sp. WMMD406]MDG4764245.1 hypothetical protein [Solwaraspora sp. WMMD406]